MENKINIILDSINKEEQKKIKDIKKSAQENRIRFKEILEMVEKYKGNNNLTKEQINKVMSITCFGSLAFCCNKECLFRDTALKILDLSTEDFLKLKNEFNKNLYGLVISKDKEMRTDGKKSKLESNKSNVPK